MVFAVYACQGEEWKESFTENTVVPGQESTKLREPCG